jgi:hypothetical protein
LVRFLDGVFAQFNQTLSGGVGVGTAGKQTWLDKDLIARVLCGVQVMVSAEDCEYEIGPEEYGRWKGFEDEVRGKLTKITQI